MLSYAVGLILGQTCTSNTREALNFSTYLKCVFLENEALGVVSVGDRVATGVWAESL